MLQYTLCSVVTGHCNLSAYCTRVLVYRSISISIKYEITCAHGSWSWTCRSAISLALPAQRAYSTRRCRCRVNSWCVDQWTTSPVFRKGSRNGHHALAWPDPAALRGYGPSRSQTQSARATSFLVITPYSRRPEHVAVVHSTRRARAPFAPVQGYVPIHLPGVARVGFGETIAQKGEM